MAELLVLAFDTFGPDQDADRFAWKLGHVIDIKPDGHPWGLQEQLPKFFKLKCPGVSVEEVKDFITNKMDLTSVPVATGIRKWKLNVNGLPSRVRTDLLNIGEITINNVNTLNGYMSLV